MISAEIAWIMRAGEQDEDYLQIVLGLLIVLALAIITGAASRDHLLWKSKYGKIRTTKESASYRRPIQEGFAMTDNIDSSVVFGADAPLKDLGEGQKRRILAHTPEMMTVEAHFSVGACGKLHTHPHLQMTYVLSGKFRFQIEDRFVEVGPGDSLAFPSGIPHGTVCLEEGILLDSFSPAREDFL